MEEGLVAPLASQGECFSVAHSDMSNFRNRIWRDNRRWLEIGLRTLQHCLGLSPVDSYASWPVNNTASNNEYLCKTFGQGNWQDTVFVSIDCEFKNGGERKKLLVRQFGLAIFDSRKFLNLGSTPTSEDLSTMIETYNYDLLEHNESKKKLLKKAHHKPFLFGDSQSIHGEEIAGMFDKVLRTGSLHENATETRNIILLGHSVGGDLSYLEEAFENFQVKDYPNVPILDTEKLAMRLYGYQFQPSLQFLTEQLNVQVGMNHVAGNDANHTLKVLLMLAFDSCDYQEKPRPGWKPHLGIEQTEDRERRRKILKNMAQIETPIPALYKLHGIEYEKWRNETLPMVINEN